MTMNYFAPNDIMYLCNAGSLIQTNINDRNNIIPDFVGKINTNSD